MDALRVLGIWEVLLQGMRGAGGHWLGFVPHSPSPTSALCCSPPWTPCRPTSWPRPGSAARGTNAHSAQGALGGLGAERLRGHFPPSCFPRACIEQQIQEYLVEDSDDEAQTGES